MVKLVHVLYWAYVVSLFYVVHAGVSIKFHKDGRAIVNIDNALTTFQAAKVIPAIPGCFAAVFNALDNPAAACLNTDWPTAAHTLDSCACDGVKYTDVPQVVSGKEYAVRMNVNTMRQCGVAMVANEGVNAYRDRSKQAKQNVAITLANRLRWSNVGSSERSVVVPLNNFASLEGWWPSGALLACEYDTEGKLISTEAAATVTNDTGISVDNVKGVTTVDGIFANLDAMVTYGDVDVDGNVHVKIAMWQSKQQESDMPFSVDMVSTICYGTQTGSGQTFSAKELARLESAGRAARTDCEIVQATRSIERVETETSIGIPFPYAIRYYTQAWKVLVGNSTGARLTFVLTTDVERKWPLVATLALHKTTSANTAQHDEVLDDVVDHPAVVSPTTSPISPITPPTVPPTDTVPPLAFESVVEPSQPSEDNETSDVPDDTNSSSESSAHDDSSAESITDVSSSDVVASASSVSADTNDAEDVSDTTYVLKPIDVSKLVPHGYNWNKFFHTDVFHHKKNVATLDMPPILPEAVLAPEKQDAQDNVGTGDVATGEADGGQSEPGAKYIIPPDPRDICISPVSTERVLKTISVGIECGSVSKSCRRVHVIYTDGICTEDATEHQDCKVVKENGNVCFRLPETVVSGVHKWAHGGPTRTVASVKHHVATFIRVKWDSGTPVEGVRMNEHVLINGDGKRYHGEDEHPYEFDWYERGYDAWLGLGITILVVAVIIISVWSCYGFRPFLDTVPPSLETIAEDAPISGAGVVAATQIEQLKTQVADLRDRFNQLREADLTSTSIKTPV